MGYECDPHQQWADEGWGDDPEPKICEECRHYEYAPFHSADHGICLARSEISEHRIYIEWMFGYEGACEDYSE